MKPFLIAATVLYVLSFAAVLIHHASKSKPVGSASKWLLVAGLLVHSGGLVERIWTTGHAPMASMYETLVFFSWTTMLVSAIVIFRYDERETEIVTVPVSVLAILFALANEKPGGRATRSHFD